MYNKETAVHFSEFSIQVQMNVLLQARITCMRGFDLVGSPRTR